MCALIVLAARKKRLLRDEHGHAAEWLPISVCKKKCMLLCTLLVGELERVRERVDATRDKPHRQATATRSARQLIVRRASPDPGRCRDGLGSLLMRRLEWARNRVHAGNVDSYVYVRASRRGPVERPK
jgi:hypothetical protein